MPTFLQSIVTTLCLDYRITFRGQSGTHHPANLWLVSYDQNRAES
jgi:hypothetical protein